MLRHLQEHSAAQANRHLAPVTYHVGDWVLVSMKLQHRRQLAVNGSLGLKQAGPYKILQVVGPQTYKLGLPPGVRIHPNFNSRFLVPYRTDDDLNADAVDHDEPVIELVDLAQPFAVDAVEGEPRADPTTVQAMDQSVISSQSSALHSGVNPEPTEVEVLPPPPRLVQGPDGDFYSSLPAHELYQSPYFDRQAFQAAGHEPPPFPSQEPQSSDPGSDVVDMDEGSEPSQSSAGTVWDFYPDDMAMDQHDLEAEDMIDDDTEADSGMEADIDALQSLDKEQVLLNPPVFKQVCKQLRFKPSIDLFASATHCQIPRYFSKGYDPKSVGQDAFCQDWQAESAPYANPPWSEIPRVLAKVVKEQVRLLLVVPDCAMAPHFSAAHRTVRCAERTRLPHR